MLLKMGKNGEMYQTSSDYSEDKGFGRNPEMVEDNNLLSLSIKEDADVKRDRQMLEQKKFGEMLNKSSFFKRVAKANSAQKSYEDRMKDADYRKSKTINAAVEVSQNRLLEEAVMQGHNYMEKNSGVSGFGMTPDGLVPDTQDYVYIHNVPDAFGSSDLPTGYYPVTGPMAPAESVSAAVMPIVEVEPPPPPTAPEIEITPASKPSADITLNNGVPAAPAAPAKKNNLPMLIGAGVVAWLLLG